MRTTIDKLVITGDSLFDSHTTNWAIDYVRDLNWRGWADTFAQDIDAEVVNTAVGGIKIEAILDDIENKILQHNPTHVIMDGGFNDIGQIVGGAPDSTAQQTYNYLEDVVDQLTAANITTLYVIVPVMNGAQLLKDPSMYAQFYGSSFEGWYNQMIKVVKNYMNIVAENLCKGNRKCHILDLTSSQLGAIGNVDCDYYFPDTLHPNEYGQAVIAAEVKKEVLKLFGRKFTKDIVPTPSGPITVDGNPVYLTIGDKLYPLTLDNEDTANANATIEWRI